MKLYVILISAVAALGGLLFGFDTGVIAGAMLFIIPHFHLGPAEQHRAVDPESGRPWWREG